MWLQIKESVNQGGNMEEYLILVRWGTRTDREGWNVEYLKKSPGGKYEFVYGSESLSIPVKVYHPFRVKVYH